MRFKFAFIYIAAGVAFVAASLWVFLSNGKSAKAIRYKYKLGGIMLTAWAMLSAASCTGRPPFVTCYEPVVTCYDVAMETDIVSVTVKDYGGNKLKPGDTMVFNIENPSYKEYRFRIVAGNPQASLIQEFNYQLPEEHTNVFSFEQVLAPKDFRGTITIMSFGVYENQDGQATEVGVGNPIYLEVVG